MLRRIKFKCTWHFPSTQLLEHASCERNNNKNSCNNFTFHNGAASCDRQPARPKKFPFTTLMKSFEDFKTTKEFLVAINSKINDV